MNRSNSQFKSMNKQHKHVRKEFFQHMYKRRKKHKNMSRILSNMTTLACKMHALNVVKEFIYVLPPTSADIAGYAGQGEVGIAQETETESCGLIAGCSSIIEKARKKNSIAICQARSSNIKGRFRTYPSAMTLRTYGIDFYQITKQPQGESTAQGGSGILRWIKYPP